MSASKLRISIGSDSFKKLVTESDVFVDKTLFINEIIDSGEEAILITRPRRWGKTSNMDMLKTFFSLEVDEEGKEKSQTSNRVLFEGGKFISDENTEKQLEKLAIAKIDNGKYINDHQGKYPVIFLSLKDISGNDIDEIVNKLKIGIKELFKGYRYLQKSAQLEKDEIREIQKHIEGTLTKEEIGQSLRLLSALLYKHHGKKVYIFVDEYDKPINYLFEGNENPKLRQNTSDFITSMLSACGKSNPNLRKIILTGIFDALKKEGGSGFNNVNVFGITDVRFSKSFGFSEGEVDSLVSKLGFEDNDQVKRNIKEWYNGYIIPSPSGVGNMHMYAAWPIMNYLSAAYKDGEYQPKSYWSTSGGSGILQTLFGLGAINSETVKKLIVITKEKENKLEYDSLTSLFKEDYKDAQYSEKVLTYLLVNLGYLTLTKKNNFEYYFRLPNNEVKKEFLEVINTQLEIIKQLRQSPEGNKTVGLTAHEKILGQYKSMLLETDSKILNAIKNGDQENLKKYLEEIESKCEYKHLKFNFFHFGAMSKNPDTNAILFKYCDHKLLAAKDKVVGLKAIDYARLSGDEKTVQLFEKDSKGSELLMLGNGYKYSSICLLPEFLEVIIMSAIFAIVTIKAGVYVSSAKAGTEISSAKANFIPVGVTAVAYVINNYVKLGITHKFGFCEDSIQYKDRYNKIDISLPEAFDSLKQFEKYWLVMNGNNSVYVGLERCVEPYKEIASISESITMIDFDELLVLKLCEYNNGSLSLVTEL